MLLPRLSIKKFLPALSLILTAHPVAGQSLPGNPGRGEVLFQQSCALCHGTGRQAQPAAGPGPLLAGVLGRPAAALPGFEYTKALKGSGLTWDAATLDRFLEAPSALVPGTNMVMNLPEPAERRDLIAFLATLLPTTVPAGTNGGTAPAPGPGDWRNDAPGVRHRISLGELPLPYASSSASNHPRTLERPEEAKLAVPPGFQVTLLISGLSGPRLLRTAPNGDIFIAETRQNRIRVIRLADGADSPLENRIFAERLHGPFGIAFHPSRGEPKWVYVANLNSVVRFPYRSGDLVARGPAEVVLGKLADSATGHNTRDVVFSNDGRQMFISVGSASNIANGMPVKSPAEIRAWEAARLRGSAWGKEANRANILVADPEGKGLRIFASGIRNAVGLAVEPSSGKLWASVNERDGLGDDLVPDYVTSVQEGGFYGWPWYYMGGHEDPRLAGARPDLAGEVIVPDVPLQAHSAALQMTFYPSDPVGPAAFPQEYRGDTFVALHGSWNRSGRTGGKVIRIKTRKGQADATYEDFLTGFVLDDTRMWGRPVGVTVARDGSLLVTDDANGTIWRVSYTGPKERKPAPDG